MNIEERLHIYISYENNYNISKKEHEYFDKMDKRNIIKV